MSEPHKGRKVRCKCGQIIFTAAPSRIKNPLCLECLRKDKTARKVIPLDLSAAQKSFIRKWGKCPGCGNPLTPLNSFKAGYSETSDMVCQGCYRRRMGKLFKKKFGTETDLFG